MKSQSLHKKNILTLVSIPRTMKLLNLENILENV